MLTNATLSPVPGFGDDAGAFLSTPAAPAASRFPDTAADGVLFLLILSGSPDVRASGSGKASGAFRGRDFRLDIVDAYAFRSSSALGRSEEVVIAVVSNQGFVPEVVDEYWDRRRALERYFKDERTGLVFLEFTTDGDYRGLSCDLGSGKGRGFSADVAVHSSVSFHDGRLRGRLSLPKGRDPKVSFEIQLDVPVSADDHGVAQGRSGGEAGRAYLAYHRALGQGDAQAIWPLLSEERRTTWQQAERVGRGADFLAFLRTGRPAEVCVTDGFIDGDQALILLEGMGAQGRVIGEALLARQHGVWKFDEETIAPVAGW